MPNLLLILFLISIGAPAIAQPQVNLGKDTVICEGLSFDLDAGNAGSSYIWSTDQTVQKISVYQTGIYNVTVTDSTGASASDTVHVVFLNEFFRQTDHWLFGEGGRLQFKPKPDSLASNKSFPAGSASISNPLGQLLMYTNGGMIYDRNGNIMPNGENIAGDPEYKANSIIIPEPGSAVNYYVFTLYPDVGLYYSKVNMEGNAGLGEVVEKNVLIDEYAGDFTSVAAADGINTWITVHNKNSDVFYSYKLDEFKVNIQPVISKTGPVIGSSNQTKVSPYGDKLAITEGNFVHLYKYNAGSGKLEHFSSAEIPGAYGVEFSRGGGNMFLSTGPLGQIYSIDVSPMPETMVPNLIYTSPDYKFVGDLQQAIDGNVYVAEEGSQCLPVIEDVNNNPFVNVDKKQCLTDGAHVNRDLPPFPQHYFKYPPGLGLRWNDTCQKHEVIISAQYYLDQFPFANVTYQIDLGDGTVIDTNYIEYAYQEAGTFDITLTVNSVCPAVTRTVPIHIDSIPVYTPLPDSIYCRGNSLVLDPQADSIYQHVWSTGSNEKSIVVNETGQYIVEIKGSDCSAIDTADIQILEYPKPDLKDWDYLCSEKGEVLTLECLDGANFLWNPTGEISKSIIINSAGTFKVIVSGENGCEVEDSTVVENICDAEIYVPDVFTPNFDQTNDTFLPKGKYVQNYELRIYNRWGELIFLSNDMGMGWDGTYRGIECETGAYGYVILYESKTRYRKNSLKTLSGHVILAK